MYRGAVSGATRLLMPNMANDIRMSCSTTRRIVPASVRPAIRLTSSPLLAIRKVCVTQRLSRLPLNFMFHRLKERVVGLSFESATPGSHRHDIIYFIET